MAGPGQIPELTAARAAFVFEKGHELFYIPDGARRSRAAARQVLDCAHGPDCRRFLHEALLVDDFPGLFSEPFRGDPPHIVAKVVMPVAIIAVIGPWIAPYDPRAIDAIQLNKGPFTPGHIRPPMRSLI